MISESDTPKSSAFWPLNWFKDEKFWRDLTVQVAGTGIVALIVVIYAGLAGYLDPAGSNVGFRLTIIWTGIALAVVAVVMGLLTVTSAREMGRREGRRAYWRYLVGVGALLLLQWSLVGVPWIVGLVSDRPMMSP